VDILPPGWEDLGAKGLVVLFCLMIFLGWLIPKRWHERAMSDKDHRIATLEEANDRLISALQDLTVSAQTGPIALRSIAKQAEKKAGDET